MRKIMCDICKKEIESCENYDEDGYSQFVLVQILNSRKYGSEEYDICNDCFEKILIFARGNKE